MVFAVDQRHLEVYYRESGNHAGAQHGLQSLFHARDELFWHRTAHDFVLEFKRGPRRRWLGDDLDLRELTRTSGLLLVRVAVLDALRDLLAEGNLWRTDIRVHFVCAFENVDLDVEVQFAHALKDRL